MPNQHTEPTTISQQQHCQRCRATFHAYRLRRYCSPTCYHLAQKESIPEVPCRHCGRSFRPKVRRAGALQTLCSAACQAGFQVGENHPRWTGGRGIDAAGYVRVRVAPNTYQREHRTVMEAQTGRRLGSDEVVHHKNRVKTDNREENLETLSRQEHAQRHRRESRLVTCLRCSRTRKHSAKGYCRSCYVRLRLEAALAADPEGTRARQRAYKRRSYERMRERTR
jgi:hypothetical protein